MKSNFLASDSFPIDPNGTISLPKIENRKQVIEYFNYRNVSDELIFEFLNDKFIEFLQSILDRDEAKIRAFAEKNFADKLVSGFDKIKESGLKLETGKGLLKGIV